MDSRQQDIVDEFALFGDWSERYQYLIDLGKQLPAYPQDDKVEAWRVLGCQSMVWLKPSGNRDAMVFEATSDSAIVSGLIALVLRVYSGRPAAEILAIEPEFIERIGRLYKVEADARRDDLDAQVLQQRRAQHSKPVLEQIEALALQHLHGVLPGSLLGKALHYLTAQWPKLVRYADDGRYPIDNNACENAIRPFVVGRRNWLFADTVGGANASANLYSLLQTCVANGIDGYRYLSALLFALPRAKTVEDYEALLPWRMAAADR